LDLKPRGFSELVAWEPTLPNSREEVERMLRTNRHLILGLVLMIMLGPILSACGPTAAPTEAPAKATEPMAKATEVSVKPTEPPPPPTDTPVPPPPAEPKSLVIGGDLRGEDSMDPHWQFSLESSMVVVMAYERLVKTTAEDWTTPIPDLADSWEVSDDGLVYTFHLNPEARFTSGNVVTAEDVRFSWMRMKNRQGSAAWMISMIEDVEVVDDHTVKVTLNIPSPAFLIIATTPYLAIVDSQVVKEHGGLDGPEAATDDTAGPWLDQNSAGSGPYILTAWSPNSEIVLEADPNHWRGEPLLDRIVIKHVEDPTTALQMAQKGDLDFFIHLDADLVDQAMADPNLKVEIVKALRVGHIDMTCDPEMSEPLSDQRVRQAILLAIDREGMIQGAWGGYGTVPPSVIPVGMPGVDPAAVQERDLEKAKALLKEAGYEDGFTETLYYPTTAVWDIVAAKVQSDLAEIGITVELNPMDYTLLLSKTFGENALPFFLMDWYPDYIDYTIWTEYWGHTDHDFGTMLHCQLPPELEEASDVIAQERDPEKRLQAVEEWQRIMMDFAYAGPIFQANEIFLLAKEVQGFGFISAQIADWTIVSK
jgi:peptide/nickel transport system substrate-binding protein